MDWLKKNWLLVLVVFVVAALALRQHYSSSLYDKLMEDYNEQTSAHEKVVEELEKVNTEQLKKQQELNDKFQKHLDQIEKSFNQKIEKINSQRKKEQKQLVEAAKKDPQSLLKKIEEVYGIPIYEKIKAGNNEKK